MMPSLTPLLTIGFVLRANMKGTIADFYSEIVHFPKNALVIFTYYNIFLLNPRLRC